MAQCVNCGAGLEPGNPRCPKCGSAVEGLVSPMPQPAQPPQYAQVDKPVFQTGNAPSLGSSAKSRMAYILLGVFLGPLGIHNFYAGYNGKGVAQLLITLLLGWLFFPLMVVWIWAVIEVCTVKQDAHGNRFS